MEDKNANVSKEVHEKFWTKSNFGRKGWPLIIWTGFILLFCSGMTVDGLNVTLGVLAERLAASPEAIPEMTATLLTYSTIAGIVTVPALFFFGWISHKKGARFITVICLIASALSYIWHGNVQTEWEYLVSLTIISSCIGGAAWVGGGTYLALWFPRKKGLALGWATMGNNFCSAIYIPMLTILIAVTGGLGMAIIPLGIVLLVLALLSKFFPNTPEKAGTTPDNLPMSAEEIDNYRKNAEAYVSQWTLKKLLMTKELWIVSISIGIPMLITVGVMSQLIPRLTSPEIGFTLYQAILTMTIAALIGVGGSYFYGWLDQKISTRKAMFVYMVVYGIGVLCNALGIYNLAFVYISVLIIGISIGGNTNWPVSITSTVFGYRDFSKAFTLVNPIFTVIRIMAFSVLAFFIRITGSLTGAYVFFAILAFIGAIVVLTINDKKHASGLTQDDIRAAK